MRKAFLLAVVLGAQCVAVRADAQTNLDALLDKIVTQDSRSWGFFRYDYGSMQNAYVVSKSSDGRVVILHGEYSYNSGSPGWVNVKLFKGQIDCLEFWNEGNCRKIGFSPTVQLLGGLRDAARNAPRSNGNGSNGNGSNGDGSYHDPDTGMTPEQGVLNHEQQQIYNPSQ